MSAKKISAEEVEKKFQEVKRRSEIKERYGVFTQKMFEGLLEELRIRLREDVRSELNSLSEKLDWLIGKYQAHDEEHTLLNGKVSEHEDRLQLVEKKIGIQI